MAIPHELLKDYGFRVNVDAPIQTMSSTVMNLEVPKDGEVGEVRFQKPNYFIDGDFVDVPKKDLDSVGFNYHILPLAESMKRTYRKNSGETFTNREILRCLHDLNTSERKKNKDIHHIFFEGLYFSPKTQAYMPSWGS